MKKSVVLAEKPSVARDLARVLKCEKKGNGYFEGTSYIVTWALGHLVTLADPESYGDIYKTWKLEDLPMLPSRLNLVVMKKTSKQFYAVKSQLNRGDVDQIIIATDAGREGELVARWILEKANVKKPIKRLWISSVTDKAIKEGFNHLRDGKQYETLYDAAVARSEADWYVGMNGTRALTTKYNAQLSCGRVQTPTLAMIAKREEDIGQFKPKSFDQVAVLSKDRVTFHWYHKETKERRIFNGEQAGQLRQKLQGQKLTIQSVSKTKKQTLAPKLYDLTELQRDANQKFGFSAKETLSTLQKLYEQHKAVTYPRTDSRFLSSDLVETLGDRLKACDVQPYRKLVSDIRKRPLKAHSNFVDDRQVTDHHAIIPTEQSPAPSALSEREAKLYQLIVRRFLAVLYPAYEYEQTKVEATASGEHFSAKGDRILSRGWKAVYEANGGEQSTTLPEITEADQFTIKEVLVTKGQTHPPARFNEGTLLTAMERPQAFMENKTDELVETLGKTGGIGTVATRADIIEKLYQSFLIEKRGKEIVITSKGKQLLTLVPADLRSPALTGEWEQKLEAIANGELKKEAFITEMKEYAKSIVGAVKASDKKFRHDNVTGSKCPECGKLMLEVNGKKGKMRVCQDRECGYKKNIAKVTNARCPKCKKKLELRGEGEGQTFACVCGHREKLSVFNERRKKNKNKQVSKREVSTYMKKQDKKEDFSNSALADALAKLKLDK
ncbi:DNA topoisomerase III [Alkalihalophilus lindianensis]|uniref:DNA topoisomerase 3 n=1 Tax=Alkalihalophilus lindianensis TaxID=1630542 RepID=A0ABU3X9R7_9BACI|nr:DNA topoisomerase III [Alkalihalophilus lindianensis]MDV2684636.1 DNA topoisomerase III [Alkalihalophilus lindianensis]